MLNAARSRILCLIEIGFPSDNRRIILSFELMNEVKVTDVIRSRSVFHRLSTAPSIPCNGPFAAERSRGTNRQTGEQMTHWDMLPNLETQINRTIAGSNI